jgi:NhaP-type Na+/H+ or K+/H+ antiporter
MRGRLTHIQSIILILLTGLILSAMLFRRKYSLFHESVSALGKIYTDDGGNTASHVIFAITFLGAGTVLASHLRSHPNIWLMISLPGFFLMPIPCDRYMIPHSIAAAMLFGGLFIWSNSALLREFRRPGRGFLNGKKALSLVCAFVPVLVYAALHAGGSELREEWQTAAVLALILLVWRTDGYRHFRSYASLPHPGFTRVRRDESS